MSLLVTRRDLEFLLYELLEIENLTRCARYLGQDRAVFDAILDAAEAIATEVRAAGCDEPYEFQMHAVALKRAVAQANA